METQSKKLKNNYLSWRYTKEIQQIQDSLMPGTSKKLAKTYDELRNQAKYKQRWKGSGSQNSEFSQPGVLKRSILSPWEAQKATAPERTNYTASGKKALRVPRVGGEFGTPSLEAFPKRFKQVLEDNIRKHKEYVQYPSRFQKPKQEPLVKHSKNFSPPGNQPGEFRCTTKYLFPNKH